MAYGILMVGDRKVADGYAAELPADFAYDLHYVNSYAPDEEKIAAGQGCAAAIVDSMATFSAAVIEGLPELKLIHVQGVGYQGVDVEAARAHHVYVCNCRAINANAVAEQAILLMLGLLRDVYNGNDDVHAGRQIQVKEAYMKNGTLVELGDCTIGLVGFGAIGRCVSKIAQACGATVYYYDAFRAPEAVERELNVTYYPLEELLPKCDIVSIHVPLLPSTENMVNADFLASMKKGAYLVNTARGEIVDSAAVLDAIRTGHLAGAGLDTIAGEPITVDNPILQAEPEVDRKLLLSPHIAGVSAGTFRRSREIVAANTARVLSGEKPVNVVNAWD